MSDRFSVMVGVGSALPKRCVSNHDLAKTIDTTHEWIVERTGIHQRYLISEGESTLTLAIDAAKAALLDAALTPDQIDVVLVATATPSDAMPSTASFVQKALGIGAPCAAMDINAACSGFMYAMTTADTFIRQGLGQRVLVIGVDCMSQILDWNDRTTCVLFGDGAGAVVLEADNEPGIITTLLGGNGQMSDVLLTQAHIENGHVRHHMHMQGREVFRNAVHALERLVPESLEKAGLKEEDIDWLVPHQANLRIIKATAKLLKMPMERVIVTLDQHGNTSAASIPLALDEGIRSGRIKQDQWILMEAFGAGFTWGSVLMKHTKGERV